MTGLSHYVVSSWSWLVVVTVWGVGLTVGYEIDLGWCAISVIGCDRLWVAIVCIGYEVCITCVEFAE